MAELRLLWAGPWWDHEPLVPPSVRGKGGQWQPFKTPLLPAEGTNSLIKGQRRQLFRHLITAAWPWQVPAAEAPKGQVHLRGVHVFWFFRSLSAHTESPYRRHTSMLNFIFRVSGLCLTSHGRRYPLLLISSLAMPIQISHVASAEVQTSK